VESCDPLLHVNPATLKIISVSVSVVEEIAYERQKITYTLERVLASNNILSSGN